jgi:RecB family endonuclease NucS
MQQLEYNSSGYCRAANEYELYKLLNAAHIGLENLQREYWFVPKVCRIDYFGVDPNTNKKLLVEVKNWFVKIDHMRQLITYLAHATELYGENGFRLILIAGGIQDSRRNILTKLGIEVYLTKELIK